SQARPVRAPAVSPYRKPAPVDRTPIAREPAVTPIATPTFAPTTSRRGSPGLYAFAAIAGLTYLASRTHRSPISPPKPFDYKPPIVVNYAGSMPDSLFSAHVGPETHAHDYEMDLGRLVPATPQFAAPVHVEQPLVPKPAKSAPRPPTRLR